MEKAEQYAYLCYRMMEGDDVSDQFFKLAIKDGFIDSDSHEWVCEEN